MSASSKKPSASTSLRSHQRAAVAVLKALLPESGTDIKGHMRSHEELLEASGYAGRPGNSTTCFKILDNELRLITPTDPEGSSDERAPSGEAGGRYYQLTHDYLVPSLREWLTRKQRETRRGRAELRLVERSSLWNAKPENRHLPLGLGVGEHPVADEEEGLDRAAADDDETGGASTWVAKLCDGRPPWSGCRCRVERPSPGHREPTGDEGCRARGESIGCGCNYWIATLLKLTPTAM